MATAPIMVLIYQFDFFYRLAQENARQSAGLYAGLAATWLILAATLGASSTSQISAGFSLAHLTPWEYLRSQFGVIVHYSIVSLANKPVLDYGWPVAKAAGDIVPYALIVGCSAY